MILSPKEKAEKLVLQFYEVVKNKYPLTNAMPLAKQCALIAVDEILEDYEDFSYKTQVGKEYWQEVKQEINILLNI